jgi:hypothetical protein
MLVFLPRNLDPSSSMFSKECVEMCLLPGNSHETAGSIVNSRLLLFKMDQRRSAVFTHQLYLLRFDSRSAQPVAQHLPSLVRFLVTV